MGGLEQEIRNRHFNGYCCNVDDNDIFKLLQLKTEPINRKTQIEDYLKAHSVNFKNAEDLKNLLASLN